MISRMHVRIPLILLLCLLLALPMTARADMEALTVDSRITYNEAGEFFFPLENGTYTIKIEKNGIVLYAVDINLSVRVLAALPGEAGYQLDVAEAFAPMSIALRATSADGLHEDAYVVLPAALEANETFTLGADLTPEGATLLRINSASLDGTPLPEALILLRNSPALATRYTALVAEPVYEISHVSDAGARSLRLSAAELADASRINALLGELLLADHAPAAEGLEADLPILTALQEDSGNPAKPHVYLPEGVTSVTVGDLTGDGRLREIDGIVGAPIALATEEGATLTLSFDLDTAYLEAEGINPDHLTIATYEEGTRLVSQLDTQLEGTVLSAQTDRQGAHFVLDRERYYERFSSVSETGETGVSLGVSNLVFIIDSTGSMGDIITSVKRNITAFVENIKARDMKPLIGLVTYKDIYEDGEDSTTPLQWFTDPDRFIAALNDISIDGGGDTLETTVDALETARRADFSSSAVTFMLFTDTGYKEGTRYEDIQTMEEEIARLSADGISVIALTNREQYYQDLVAATGGLYLPITADLNESFDLLADHLEIETMSGGVWVDLVDRPVFLAQDPLLGDLAVDSDGDGVPDLAELGEYVPRGVYTISGELPMAWTYRTDPSRADTDGDGVSDLYATDADGNPLYPEYIETDSAPAAEAEMTDITGSAPFRYIWDPPGAPTARQWRGFGCVAIDGYIDTKLTAQIAHDALPEGLRDDNLALEGADDYTVHVLQSQAGSLVFRIVAASIDTKPVADAALLIAPDGGGLYRYELAKGLIPSFESWNLVYGQCTWYAGGVARVRNGQPLVTSYSQLEPLTAENLAPLSVLGAESNSHMLYLDAVEETGDPQTRKLTISHTNWGDNTSGVPVTFEAVITFKADGSIAKYPTIEGTAVPITKICP